MSEPITIMAVGDLVVDQPDPEFFFAPSASVLSGADLAIGQLEIPHSTTTNVASVDVPSPPGDPGVLAVLRNAGFDVLTLAGNHVADSGLEGIVDTIRHSTDAGILTAGAGPDLPSARTPAIVERGGHRIGVLSFNCVGPRESWATSRKAGAAYVDIITHYETIGANPGGPPAVYTVPVAESLAAMKADIAALAKTVDVVVVALHKGLVHSPVELASYEGIVSHAAIDAGATVVLGHHSHVTHGVEFYRGRAIFHGLGNFVTVTKALSVGTADSVELKAWAARRKKLFGFEPDPTMPGTYPFHPDSRNTAIAVLRVRSPGITEAGEIMNTDRPLAGKTVLDLTTALSGPYATLLLAGLGARVIKIENPALGGDTSRNNSPYFTAEGLKKGRVDDEDMSVSMMLRGRNKQSMTLNLKRPEALQIFRDMIGHADIVVENYSAGVTARLGIDYDSVRELNPALVYTSISGFGAQGLPNGGGKAMDTIIQALSGVMMTAGSPGDPPVRFGLPVGDLVAPLFAVIGTLAAILEADRTGHGQHVDVSMLGALTSLVASEPFDAFEKIGMPSRTGDLVPRLAPFGTFPAMDGWFALCAPTDAFAHGVLVAMGMPELAGDPRFEHRDGRVAHADELHAMIGQWAQHLPVDEVVSRLEANGVPTAPVRNTGEAVSDPLVLARGEVEPLVHPTFGVAPGLFGSGLPIVFSETSTSLTDPAPRLGQHTVEVLQSLLGYGPEQIDALRAAGAL
jgi:CoA:oxalate CoA-transferase